MPHILVVDDTPLERDIAAQILRTVDGWTIHTAASGEAALLMLREVPVDVIVSDLQMPDVDGLELLEAVHESFPHVPLVIMTARGSEETAVNALQKGAASYVSKSHLLRDLVPTISSVLTHAARDLSEARLMSGMIRKQATFRLPNDSSLIPQAVSYVQGVLDEFSLCDERDRVRIGVAVEEAMVNALVHGNLGVSSELRERGDDSFSRLCALRGTQEPYCDRHITLDIQAETDEMTLTIRDEGEGFDVDALPDPTDIENLARCSGRGILLMRSFLDVVRYNEKGNEVTLVKRRRGDHEDSRARVRIRPRKTPMLAR
ncbi:MAG: response regulator [Planctomycetaceae bacterium]|nr:response regulator [Planctomycetaceae bacterium]